MKICYILLVLVLLAMAAAGGGIMMFKNMLQGAGMLSEEKIVYIEPGSSVKAIAAKLTTEGVIAEEWVFTLASRLQSSRGGLKAGEYVFPAASSVQQAIGILQGGKTYQRKITIPEGLTVLEIASLVSAAEAMTGNSLALIPEGGLLPETYSYTYNEERIVLLTRMQKAMQDAVKKAWEGRDVDIPLKSPEEMVVLASIVEKETGVAAERPRVAGVFINRLKQGMPLQSDPTVIYAITLGKKDMGRALYKKDLEIESPYNTYKISGLPPTPIANPGRESLEAVAHPEKHDFIYFVADGSGGHAFAKTLNEHNNNVALWRKIQKQSP